MLKDASRGRFDVVLAWALDRLGRSLIDLLDTLGELDAASVALVLHQQAIDTTTPAGRMFFQVTGAFAEFERGMIRSRVLAGLEVRPERMARNLDASGGVVYSHRALLALVESGLSREDAYRIVQSAAHRALDGDGGFRSNLEADPVAGARLGDRMDAIFDPQDFLRHVDLAFDRLGLGVRTSLCRR